MFLDKTDYENTIHDKDVHPFWWACVNNKKTLVIEMLERNMGTVYNYDLDGKTS